ncbi:hypothetical protein MAPG_10683 [Magnaporthiopsis poae ATCC 64411]|uniref:Heterokaryon incompatibility domain-containing protein n=1 Tax=Magnaporthiopsis poae (strain ATCC 64411 / 73-15) TaxID=644358 RepID=A0A0C4ED89_MAGP6|nr:hypothetical protein MAPG_10683 [Magnaporthiopsis poae ATCC 64411]
MAPTELEPQNLTTQCQNCAFFAEAILQAVPGEAADIDGSWPQVERAVSSFEAGCDNCGYILELLELWDPAFPLLPTCTLWWQISPQKRFFLGTLCGCREHAFFEQEFLPSPELAPNSTHFTTIDPDRIEIGHLNRWPEYCDARHAGCHDVSQAPPAKDIVLIDAQDHCLVTFPVAPTYIALSYVWGHLQNILETTIANFADLRLPNALLGPRLPRTIRDAITVTRALGQRYLWVDRLCIVQDDEANKALQIAAMASIYANAYCTIVAADGADADAGLGGVGVPRSPSFPRVLELGADCHLRPAPEVERASSFTAWHSRGWTFQERLLTRRSLVFFRGTVKWQCRSSIWAEGVAAEPEGFSSDNTWPDEDCYPSPVSFDTSFMLRFERLPRPQLRQYEDLVREYSRRKLTHETDGLRAFSGILDVLSRTYPGGFLYGLPLIFFDMAMLWEPESRGRPRIAAPGSSALLFPSWSWAAWEGFASNTLSVLLSDPPSIEVYPLVKWYHVPPAGKTNFVNAALHSSHRMRQHGGTQNTDVGFFSTPAIHVDKVTADTGSWDRLLHCSAMRAFFHVRPAEPRWPREFEYCLLDVSNKLVGWLNVPSQSRDEALQGGKLLECIAISGCKAYDELLEMSKTIYFPEWDMMEETRHLPEYEFYNVLWIEWRDGVAYRKALGRCRSPSPCTAFLARTPSATPSSCNDVRRGLLDAALADLRLHQFHQPDMASTARRVWITSDGYLMPSGAPYAQPYTRERTSSRPLEPYTRVRSGGTLSCFRRSCAERLLRRAPPGEDRRESARARGGFAASVGDTGVHSRVDAFDQALLDATRPHASAVSRLAEDHKERKIHMLPTIFLLVLAASESTLIVSS